MKKTINPVFIGAFVVGAALIAVIAIGLLASGVLFKETAPFVAYFDESVDGLDVGAPVKWNGIKIGEVSEIGFYAKGDPPERFASVMFEIDLDYVRNVGVKSDMTDPRKIRESIIEHGLRVRLELASIVTGVVFLELEFDPDAPPPTFVRERPPFPEIPTRRSALAELGQSATEVIARLSAVDAPAIGAQLQTVLATIDTTLSGVRLREVTDSLLLAVADVRRAIDMADVASSRAKLQTTLDEFYDVAVLLNERLEPTLARVDSSTQKLDRTLLVFEAAVEDVGDVFRPDSEILVSLQEAADANRRAMESMRVLAEMLERNPRVLLTGKPENRN